MTEAEAHRDIDAILKGYAIGWRLQADEANDEARKLINARDDQIKATVLQDPNNLPKYIHEAAAANQKIDTKTIALMDQAIRLRRLAGDADRGILALTVAEKAGNQFIPLWLISAATQAKRLKTID